MTTAEKLNAPTTEEVVAAMLTENTGKHFLDSGGENGRMWQRNQGRDFAKEPSGTLEVSVWKPETHKGDWMVTLSVYHFLCERLKFSSKWQQKFDAFIETQNDYTPWLQLMHDFVDHLREQGHEVCDPIDRTRSEPFCVNTYNHDSFLSQVLQYIAMEVDGEPLYLLQIHGGADVRGGYTAPKCFTENGHSEWPLFDDCRATICCDKCHANWTSDGGGHFGYDGGSGDPLDEYPVVRAGDDFHGVKVKGPAKGRVYLYANKSVSCPKCAKGHLHAFSF